MENMTTPAVFHDADWERYFKSVDVMSAVIYSLVCVLGVSGNGLVIWVLGFRVGKSYRNVLVLNLAVADFLGTVFLPLNITQRALDNWWPFGWVMCKCDSMVFYLRMYASIYVMVLLSVVRCFQFGRRLPWKERRHTIRLRGDDPLRSGGTVAATRKSDGPTCAFRMRFRISVVSEKKPAPLKNAFLVSLGVWVTALALSIPHVISRELDFGYCGDYPEPSLVITNLVVGFVFPFIVIVSCNSLFIYRVRKKGAFFSNLLLKIAVAVTAAYFLCFAPFHIIRLIAVVATPSKTRDAVLEFGVPISHALALLNSCLNPLLYLYVFTSGRLRRCGDSVLKVLEKAFAEDQPNNTSIDVQWQTVCMSLS